MNTLAAIAFLSISCQLATIELASGDKVNPLASHGQRATVLIFGLAECPITRKYSPEFRRLNQEFSPKKVNFVFVHVDPSITLSEVRKHASEFGISFPSGVDRNHEFVRLTHTKVVPTAAVFSASGQLVYSGRIDDVFTGIGQQKKSAAKHDLKNAIRNLLAGKKIAVARTEAVGCDVPPLSKG